MGLQPNCMHFDRVKDRIIADGLMHLLLQSDGSTTRMLEAMVGSDLTLNIHQQDIAAKENLPYELIRHFDADGPFLRRVISLCYQGEILSDNIVLACLKTIDPELQSGLIEGQIPLGKLISNVESRRSIIQSDYQRADQLNPYIYPIRLIDNIYPVKKYLILHNKKCWFYICEIFHSQTILKLFYTARRSVPIGYKPILS